MAGIMNKESPFTPGRPVPIEYFVARFKEITRLERAVKQASSGRNENIFILGERGIGKSSLASFIRYLAEKEYDFISAHCFLGGVKDLEGMIRIIFQRLLQEVSDKSIFDSLKDIFDKYIKAITLFGVGVEFTENRSKLRTLIDNFLPAIKKINETIKERKKGIMLDTPEDPNIFFLQFRPLPLFHLQHQFRQCNYLYLTRIPHLPLHA